jgi:hypothetical protein
MLFEGRSVRHACHWQSSGINPEFRGKKPASSSLSHGTTATRAIGSAEMYVVELIPNERSSYGIL